MDETNENRINLANALTHIDSDATDNELRYFIKDNMLPMADRISELESAIREYRAEYPKYNNFVKSNEARNKLFALVGE